MITGHLILLFAMYTGLTLFPTIPSVPITPVETTQIKEVMTGKATRYDYNLSGYGGYSKTHSTCALRIIKRYQKFKVCTSSGKCIVCLHNDYGPVKGSQKIIDLSSYAFSRLSPLSKGVIDVFITLEK